MDRQHFIVIAIILAVIGASLSIASTLYFSLIRTEKMERGELSHLADVAGYRAHVLFKESYQVLKSIEAMNVMTPCSKEHINLMRQAILSLHSIDELEYFENGVLKCSAYQMTEEKLQLIPSNYTMSNGIEIMFNFQRMSTEDRDEIAIRYKNYVMLIDPVQFTNIIVESYIQIAITTADGHVISTLNNPDLNLVKKILNNNHELKNHKDNLIAVTKIQDLVAIAIEPRSALMKKWYNELLIFLPFGLLMAGLVVAIIFWASRRRLSPLGELKKATARHEFIVYYQPIIELKTGACVGAEALIRWRRPDGKIIKPDFFIPLAEDNGLIKLITDQVVQIVIEDWSSLLSADRKLHIAINITADDLKTGRILQVIETALSGTGIEPNQIWFEVTEREFMDIHSAQQSITKAHELGYSVAIDDFGTGYSTLSYLQELSLDVLKIDKIFIRSLNVDSTTSIVASQIIKIAKTLKMKIVAEGVETQAQVNYLVKHGVEYGQGWLYAKALPINEFIEFYKSNKLVLFQIQKNFDKDDIR